MRGRALHGSFGQVLVVCLFAAAIAPISLSLLRRTATFGRADLLVSVEESAFRVRHLGRSATPLGLSVGDLVYSIDAKDAVLTADPGERLAQSAADLTILRNDQLLRLTTKPAPSPIDFRYLVLVTVGLAFFVAGFAAVRPGSPAPRENVLFAAFALSVALVLILTPAPPLDGVFASSVLLEDLCRAIFPALLLRLVFSFPRRAAGIPLWIFDIPALALALAALWTYLVPGAPTSDATLAVLRLDRLQAVWMTGAAIAAAVRLAVLSRRRIDLLAEKQVRFLLFGTAAGLLPLCLLDLVPRLFGGEIPLLSSLSLVPLGLVPLAFLAALERYRLWDVEVLGRETTALLITLFLGAGFFTALQLSVPEGIGVPHARSALQVSAGLLLALSFVPLHRGLSRSLSRIQYRDGFESREGLVSLIRDLPTPRRRHEIESLLVSRVRLGLGVRPCALLLVVGGDRLDAGQVDGGHPFVVSELPVELSRRPIRLTRQVLLATPTDAVTRLRRGGFRTLAPVAVSGRLLAVMALGDREGRVPLSHEDLSLLEMVLAAAALALDHARLYEELQGQAERYRTLKEFHENVVAGSLAAIAATDATGRFTSANPAFERLVGRTATELRSLRDDEVLPEPVRQAAAGSTAAPRLSVELGGAQRVVDIAVSTFPGTENDGRARVYVLQDVTETARLEKALVDRERLSALGTLSAGVAHEVNTPLTGVASFARLLLDDTPEGDPRRELVLKIEKQAFRASRLVSSLLDLARGKPRDLSPVRPADLVREARSALAEEFEARDAVLELEMKEPVPAVLGHADALVQVLVNLLKNGLEAAAGSRRPGQAPHVTLRVSLQHDEASKSVRFDVVDNGPGLAAAATSRVFDPFYSTKTAQGGTGLGLAIARDIIQAHGGAMEVISRLGEGASFTVLLPVAPSSLPDGSEVA